MPYGTEERYSYKKPGRDYLIGVFEESMRLCGEHPVLKEAVRRSIAGERIIWEADALPEPGPRFEGCAETLVSAKRTVEAASAYAGERVCVLNFASCVTPGGGVVKGAGAQEESICRVSSLYPALADLSAAPFYVEHKRRISEGALGRENTDDVIWTPGVVGFRRDDLFCGTLPEEEWCRFDVLTCAAPDLRRYWESSDYCPEDDELRTLITKRVDRILRVAALEREDVLILGAFGCGVFRNPPEMVAEAFAAGLERYGRCFRRAEFAVYTPGGPGENFRAFAERFN